MHILNIFNMTLVTNEVIIDMDEFYSLNIYIIYYMIIIIISNILRRQDDKTPYLYNVINVNKSCC